MTDSTVNKLPNALHISKNGTAKIAPIALPELGSDEVIVEPKFWGVCGSDLKLFDNTYNFPHANDLVPGHEWVGYISSVGNSVSAFKVGDRVTGECSVFCDKCYFCNEVNKNLCEDIKKHGISTDGFASERVVVNQRYLHSLKTIDCEDELCVFVEPIAVVLQGLKEVDDDFSRFRSVLILGAGTIGLLTGLAIRNKNPNVEVTIADNKKERLEIAEKFGLRPILCDLNAFDSHEKATVYDMMVESSGFSGCIDIVKNHVRPAGHVLLFTMNTDVHLPQDLVVKDMIKFHGNLGGAGSFTDAIRLLSDKRELISLLIDNQIDFDRLPGIINSQTERLNCSGKTLVRM